MRKLSVAGAVVVSLLLGVGCLTRTEAPKSETPSLNVTDWTQKTELYMEYPPLVQGRSVLFAVPVARGASAYPRWMVLASPAVVVMLIAACASVTTWSRALIAPASPNLAHVIFFAVTTTYVAPHRRS